MKALIAFIASITLIGCVSETASPDTLSPLPTTGVPSPSDEQADFGKYFVFIHERVSVPAMITHNTLLEHSETWCDFMERGMGKTNVVAWITEMASDQAEMDLWLASAEASAYYICPKQAYKWNP